MKEEKYYSAIEYICEKMADRSAVLFLGAGINAGIMNDKGASFPLGCDLSKMIAKDILGDASLDLTLDEAAEIARYKIGEPEFNRFLYELFSSFIPGEAHEALVQLPWDVIFTTNYDLLVESAAGDSFPSAGKIKPIFSSTTDLTGFKEEDILYYKLHGSVDHANTKEGRLILTKEDYRYYLEERRPLFKRLKHDLQNRSFIFIGYSLNDPNFREILQDCRDALGASALPKSFAIRDRLSEVEKGFWKEKYNIEVVAEDGKTFLKNLNGTWVAQSRSVTPLAERASRRYVRADTSASFQRVGDSFFIVDPTKCTGLSNPELFFKGAEPTWGEIKDAIAPKRDIYWTLYEALFPDLTNPGNPSDIFLLTGFAGTGKTTLLYSLAYELASDSSAQVLIHMPGTPLDIGAIRPLIKSEGAQRLILIVKHAAEIINQVNAFFEEAKRTKLPLTIILEERRNQWISAVANRKIQLNPYEFDLGSLSLHEIEDILTALERYGQLGKLTGIKRAEQIEHFTSLADKELLVALRELTTGNTFDEIIKDEFNKIPSERAKKAYVFVAALSQIDLAIRYETLTRVLNMKFDKLGELVFRPTEGILISTEEVGYSRHNFGYRIRTRHPIIASIIFGECAPNDEAKYEIIDGLLVNLDPGFPEDSRMLKDITRKRELVYTLESIEKRRAVYERLRELMPDNPYVIQHRSILEKEMGNGDLAVKYAREALKYDKENQELLNTLGMAVESQARNIEDPYKWRAMLQEARKIFEDNIRRNQRNPYGHLGIIFILKQEIKRSQSPDEKDELISKLVTTLEEAYEITDESNIIALERGKQQEILGDTGNAITILEKAMKRKPEDLRLRDVLIRLLLKVKPEQAMKIAVDGLKLAPTSWRLNRYVARIKRAKNEPVESVRGFYEAAIRHNKGDVGLLIEHAAYLFMNKRAAEAVEFFEKIKKMEISGYEKKRIREYWEEKEKRRLFKGIVSDIIDAAGYALSIPENIRCFFYRTTPQLSSLKKGDRIEFSIGFNAWGPFAVNISPEK